MDLHVLIDAVDLMVKTVEISGNESSALRQFIGRYSILHTKVERVSLLS